MFTHSPYTCLNCCILDHILNNFCPQVFFFSFLQNSTIDNFCHHVKTPAARGSAMFHSMENRWQGRDAEMDAWKKKKKDEEKRHSHTETHTEIQQDTAHTVPMRGIGGVCVYACVLMSGELGLCVYLSKQFTCSGVCYEAN